MKKASKQQESSARSLRDIPPVDFTRLRPGRPNPFAARMASEGWTLVHQEPSKASLEEMPELPPGARGKANPYADSIAATGILLQVGRHRPKPGTEVGPTETKSVRLPPAVWKRLRRDARERGLTLHALVRTALLQWLDEHPGEV